MEIEEKERIINYMIYRDRDATIRDYQQAAEEIHKDINPDYVIKKVENKGRISKPYYQRSLLD